jgi:23S rRNA (guanosine2251-2'-O)-methyltransferase
MTMKENNRESLLMGRNPVMEALEEGRTIEKLLVQKGSERFLIALEEKSRDRKIPLEYVDKAFLNRITDSGNHQGVVALTPPFQYGEVEDIFRVARERGEDPLVVILDHLEDPHNLGAIIRSAEGAGAHGIILPNRRAAGVTPTVVKTSAGTVFYLPVVKVSNLPNTMEELKKKGLWMGACDMGSDCYTKQDLTGPMGLVIGSEGVGISRLVKEKCDFVVSIPMKGRGTSLNASNAAAVMLYEARRQRDEKKV